MVAPPLIETHRLILTGTRIDSSVLVKTKTKTKFINTIFSPTKQNFHLIFRF